MPGLLATLRVVDLTHYIAGPFCTKLLADYGAEVIKVEKPGCGDGARRVGPFPGGEPHPEKSASFYYLNNNKKSITLDLDTSTGRGLLCELLKDADVLVESFQPAAMARWGLSFEEIQAINSRLVMTSISNFGQTGPYRHYQMTHLSAAAIGGWMHLMGNPAREPLQAGNRYYLYMTGVAAAAATMLGVWAARTSGEGRHVDVSIYETVASTIPYHNVVQSFSVALANQPPVVSSRRKGNLFPGIVRCQDGLICINLLIQTHWEKLCLLAGQTKLLDDPRFAMSEDRDALREELRDLFAPWFAERTCQEVYRLATLHRIPSAFVNTPEDVLKSPPLVEREYFAEVEHPYLGRVTTPGAPFRPERAPWEINSPAPALGQHNEEILCGYLGLSKEDLPRLRAVGVI